MNKIRMPPEERTIGAPEGGWEKGVYLVEVAFNANNPIHNAILTVQFLRDIRVGSLKGPGSCMPTNEELYCPNWEETHRISDLHYLKVLSKSEELSKHLL